MPSDTKTRHFVSGVITLISVGAALGQDKSYLEVMGIRVLIDRSILMGREITKDRPSVIGNTISYKKECEISQVHVGKTLKDFRVGQYVYLACTFIKDYKDFCELDEIDGLAAISLERPYWWSDQSFGVKH